METKPASGDERQPAEKKRGGPRLLIKILIWLLVIAGVVYLTLFLASKIGDGFDSVADVVEYIRDQIGM